MELLPVINSITTLKDAFAQIQSEHPGLNHFLHGTYADLIAESRSNIKYPCLMLEIPDISFKDNGSDYRMKGFQGAFIILKNHKTKTKEDRLVILDELCDIVEQIIIRLYDESVKHRRFNFRIEGNPAEQISPLTQDYDIGWRYEFNIHPTYGLVHNPENWS